MAKAEQQLSVVAEQLNALRSTVAELRDGQHALLDMYEELRVNYPANCRCAQEREQARADVLASDPFAPEANHEDYVPDERY